MNQERSRGPFKKALRYASSGLVLLGAALFANERDAEDAPCLKINSDNPIVFSSLGTSVTKGVDVAVGESFSSQIAQHLSMQISGDLTLNNLGEGGQATRDLLSKLKDDQDIRDKIQGSDLISVEIGINDIGAASYYYLQGKGCGGENGFKCLVNAETDFERDFGLILEEIRAINESPYLVLITMSIYTPPIDETILPIHNGFVHEMNVRIKETSDKNNAIFLDIRKIFNGEMDNLDPLKTGLTVPYTGVHPSQEGHKKIALMALDKIILCNR